MTTEERIAELEKAREAKLQMINTLSAQGEDVSFLYKEVQKIEAEIQNLKKAPAGKVKVGGSVLSYPMAGILVVGSYLIYQKWLKNLFS